MTAQARTRPVSGGVRDSGTGRPETGQLKFVRPVAEAEEDRTLSLLNVILGGTQRSQAVGWLTVCRLGGFAGNLGEVA